MCEILGGAFGGKLVMLRGHCPPRAPPWLRAWGAMNPYHVPFAQRETLGKYYDEVKAAKASAQQTANIEKMKKSGRQKRYYYYHYCYYY